MDVGGTPPVAAFEPIVCPLTRQLRKIMVQRMAKPEEVIVVENEQGEVVREVIKDTDAMNLYKSMRESLGRWLRVQVVLLMGVEL